MVGVRNLHRFGQQCAKQAVAGVFGCLCLSNQQMQGCQALFQQMYGLRALGITRRQPGRDFPRKGGVPVNAGARLVRLRDRQAVGGLLLLANA